MRTASIIALMMEAVRTSETSVYPNETTQSYILEGPNLHTRSRENLTRGLVHIQFSSGFVAMKNL
jgi:hypothetical protein